MSLTYDFCIDLEDFGPLTVEYTPGWYDPGVCSGPPEICYPPEGEPPTIHSICNEHGTEVQGLITRAELEYIEQKLEEYDREQEYGY